MRDVSRLPTERVWIARLFGTACADRTVPDQSVRSLQMGACAESVWCRHWGSILRANLEHGGVHNKKVAGRPG